LIGTDLYENQGEKYVIYELEYLCKYYEIDGLTTISLALGWTGDSVKSKLKKIRKQGLYKYYKNLNKYQ